MPAPIVAAALITGAFTVGSKIFESIANKVGKKRAEKITKRAVELQNKQKRTDKENKELQHLRVQYPIIGTELERIKNEAQGVEGKAQLQGNPQTGYPAQELRFQRFSPEQQVALHSLLNGSLSQLGKTNLDFAPIENKARQDFVQKTIPSIAERFSAANAQRSSAFPQALSQAGSELETNLGALGAQYNLQKHGALSNLVGLGLTPQYSSAFFPGQAGIGGTGNQGLGQTIGSEGLKLLTNPDVLTAFTEWYKNRGQKQQDQSTEQDFIYNPQLINPGNGQVNSTNAMQAVINPNNLSSTNNTNNGFHNPINPSAPVTNQQAAQFLYGLR